MLKSRRQFPDRLHLVVFFAGILLILLLLSACGSSPTPEQATNPPATATQAEAQLPATQTLEPTETATATLPPTETATLEPTLTPTATSLPDQIEDQAGISMVLVPAGEFTMGSNTNQAAAVPAHTVYLGDYYIDQYEVTNELYLACVEAGGCPTGGSSRLRNPTYVGHPVMDVTWYEAQNYCEWRGASLPTEAQWEKAARGTDERTFPWGNEPVTCELARYGDCGWFTVPVGQHPLGVSPYGAFDMAGNAWEWTHDWYEQDYYSVSPLENPTGPERETGWKSTRGGAWFYDARLQTSIWRNQAPPTAAYSYLGFRCARTP